VRVGPSLLVTEDTAKLISPIVNEIDELLHMDYPHACRIAVLFLGTSAVLLGIAAVALPGPTFLFVPLGLAILGIEITWIRRWLASVRRTSQQSCP